VAVITKEAVMKKIDVELNGSLITVNPSSANIDAGDQVIWRVKGAQDWNMVVEFQIPGVTPGRVEKLISIPSPSRQEVWRKVAMPLTGNPKPDPTTALYKITFKQAGSSDISASANLVIERGIEPTDPTSPPHHRRRPYRGYRPNASHPEAAGAPDSSGEEQRPGQ
jgi:plastocyanin